MSESWRAAEQFLDDADGLILPISLQHGVDSQCVGIRWQGTGSATKDGSTAGHMIELNNPLGHIERMMVGQGHNTGTQFDTMATLARRSQKHLWRRNHFPAGRMMFAAPELVKT